MRGSRDRCRGTRRRSCGFCWRQRMADEDAQAAAASRTHAATEAAAQHPAPRRLRTVAVGAQERRVHGAGSGASRFRLGVDELTDETLDELDDAFARFIERRQ